MDRIQVTLALAIAAIAVAVTYVKANTAPLDASMITADIFACQQPAAAEHATAHIVAMRPDAARSPACLQMTN